MKKKVTALLLIIVLTSLCSHAFARKASADMKEAFIRRVPDNTTFDYKEVSLISGNRSYLRTLLKEHGRQAHNRIPITCVWRKHTHACAHTQPSRVNGQRPDHRVRQPHCT